MIVTVSDANGIKQYDIPNSIKKIIISFLFVIALIISGLTYYVKTLHDKVVVLEQNIKMEKIVEKVNKQSKLAFNPNSMLVIKSSDNLENIRLLKLEEAKKLELLVEIEKAKKLKLIKIKEKEALAKAEKSKKLKKEKLAKLAKAKKEKLAKVKEDAKKKALAKAEKAKKLKKEKLAKLAKAKKEKLAKAKEDAKKKALAKAEKAKKLKKEKLAKLAKAKKEKLAKAKEDAKKKALAKVEKAKKLKKEKLAKLAKAKKVRLAKLKKSKLSSKKVSKKENLLHSIAKEKLGRRYVWGAVGPSRFDCSGFTSYVYKKTGINIPRTSRQQSRYGKLVDRKHLKPGDLIFFDTSRRKKGIINHVGMYIGNNKFIHASSAKKRVVITSLNTNFYSKRFKWARRVIH